MFQRSNNNLRWIIQPFLVPALVERPFSPSALGSGSFFAMMLGHTSELLSIE
jgi:hypothetical protein